MSDENSLNVSLTTKRKERDNVKEHRNRRKRKVLFGWREEVVVVIVEGKVIIYVRSKIT